MSSSIGIVFSLFTKKISKSQRRKMVSPGAVSAYGNPSARKLRPLGIILCGSQRKGCPFFICYLASKYKKHTDLPAKRQIRAEKGARMIAISKAAELTGMKEIILGCMTDKTAALSVRFRQCFVYSCRRIEKR